MNPILFPIECPICLTLTSTDTPYCEICGLYADTTRVSRSSLI